MNNETATKMEPNVAAGAKLEDDKVVLEAKTKVQNMDKMVGCLDQKIMGNETTAKMEPDVAADAKREDDKVAFEAKAEVQSMENMDKMEPDVAVGAKLEDDKVGLEVKAEVQSAENMDKMVGCLENVTCAKREDDKVVLEAKAKLQSVENMGKIVGCVENVTGAAKLLLERARKNDDGNETGQTVETADKLTEQNGEGVNDGGERDCFSTMLKKVKTLYVRYVGSWPL